MVDIKRLTIEHQQKRLVDISFSIKSSLALVGESGSGKSLTLKALLGMEQTGLDVILEKESDFEFIKGDTIALVPQNPFTALSPLTKIKNQLFFDNKVELFKQFDLDESLLDRYPKELSGGQLQRVVIAIALATHPKLLLLDEPTTALDYKSKENLLKLLKDKQKEIGFKILFVTHDIASAMALCDDIAILQNGFIVEYGMLESIISSPKEVYTKKLIEADFKNRGFRT